MKQYSQVNIIHNNKQLHYMVEFHDAGIIDVTHGEYSYYTRAAEGIQFIRNTSLIDNYENNHITNVVRNINTWTPETRLFSNLYIPRHIFQRQLTLYIPRYSMESFYDKEFGDDHEMNLSGIKYILTAYIYIAGVKVILGSYMFDLGSARATTGKTHYKMDDYQICVDFNIVDPVSLTYNDEWEPFRQIVCNEPEFINNTGSVIHIDLDPVIDGIDGSIIRSSNFIGGITSVPFQKFPSDYLNAKLTFDGDAKIDLVFNEVYGDDIELYLGETYDTWQRDPDTDEIIRGLNNEPIPQKCWVIFELIIRDAENIYSCNTKLVKYDSGNPGIIFEKHDISKSWSWFKPGLIMQGGVEIYVGSDIDKIDEDDINEKIEIIRSTMEPVVNIVSNEIHLNKETYKYLVPTSIMHAGKGKINLDLVNMTEYEVNVVNKIHKNVININRPEDYKSNVVKPVFIRTEKISDIIIHPAVTENISINLDKYKSKVDLFYLRIEGVDFIEIGRTPQSVVFGVDGNLLPNEVTEGVAYILNENHTLVTTGHYTYEQ